MIIEYNYNFLLVYVNTTVHSQNAVKENHCI